MPRPVPFIACLLVSTGCAHHVLTIQQASPNPFLGRTRINIAPPDWSRTTVNHQPVAAWVKEGGAEEEQDWPKNTSDATQHFYAKFPARKGVLEIATVGQPAAGDVVVTSILDHVETGFFAGPFGPPTRIALHVLVGVDGQTADEIIVTADAPSSIFQLSFNRRLSRCMEDAASQIVGYLLLRAGRR